MARQALISKAIGQTEYIMAVVEAIDSVMEET